MKGLEFFKSRNYGEKVDFKSEELKYNIKLPPKFRLFLNLYDIKKLNRDSIYWKENNFKYPINGPIYGGRLV